MRVIGLTGSIACGKSTISAMLKEKGAAVVDGDAIARALQEKGSPALADIRAAFGDGVFCADGSLDRSALGQRVFGDEKALAVLDGIMQPRILARIRDEMAAAQTFDICVLDMPLLFEKGLESLCDSVWCAWADEETQITRLKARNGLDREAALKRIRSQWSAAEKARRSSVVIDTTVSLAHTYAQVCDCLKGERSHAT